MYHQSGWIYNVRADNYPRLGQTNMFKVIQPPAKVLLCKRSIDHMVWKVIYKVIARILKKSSLISLNILIAFRSWYYEGEGPNVVSA